MEKSFIIDNSILSFALTINNGIPVLSYYDNKEDNFLWRLTEYIRALWNSSNPL